MANKRHITFCTGICRLIIIALSCVYSGCFTATYTSGGPPNLDYTLLGPYDSAILVYIDPALQIGKGSLSKTSKMLFFKVKVTPGNLTSEMIVNYTGEGQARQCQMTVPNGSYTLHVDGSTYSGKAEVLPFTVSLNDLAITYKIRRATDEEKKAGGLGVGNEAFTLEEVSQIKLR